MEAIMSAFITYNLRLKGNKPFPHGTSVNVNFDRGQIVITTIYKF